ncbi:MAG: hypothetical protein ABI348_00075, partial [Nitrososphaera sp.]
LFCAIFTISCISENAQLSINPGRGDEIKQNRVIFPRKFRKPSGNFPRLPAAAVAKPLPLLLS